MTDHSHPRDTQHPKPEHITPPKNTAVRVFTTRGRCKAEKNYHNWQQLYFIYIYL